MDEKEMIDDLVRLLDEGMAGGGGDIHMEYDAKKPATKEPK